MYFELKSVFTTFSQTLFSFFSVYSGHQSILIPPTEIETNPALWLTALSQHKGKNIKLVLQEFFYVQYIYVTVRLKRTQCNCCLICMCVNLFPSKDYMTSWWNTIPFRISWIIVFKRFEGDHFHSMKNIPVKSLSRWADLLIMINTSLFSFSSSLFATLQFVIPSAPTQ